MTPLEHAKQLLPLPELLARFGLGDCAKKTAKCPFHDDANNSFSVYQTTKGNWAWKCHAGCGSGDEADFIARLETLSKPDGCRRYIELAGARGNSTPAPKHAASRALSALDETPANLPAMPSEVADLWREGVDYAQAHPLIVKHLAKWRGWGEPFAQYLIGCAAVSMPHHDNERGIAFQVVAPIGERGAMTTSPIGYHVRVKPDSPEKKASWRYVPNEQAHSHGIPALPYVLGDFETAQLLVITEGPWDALTFALAAGWLGDGCLWPDGVGLIGIRGVFGINSFLKYYRRFWPANANCLLLPDGDGPGGRWFNGADTFADRLASLCLKVAVVRCGAEKDFNDLFRAQEITPDQITDLLESHGMGLEMAVLT